MSFFRLCYTRKVKNEIVNDPEKSGKQVYVSEEFVYISLFET